MKSSVLPFVFISLLVVPSCKKNTSIDMHANVNVANDVIIAVSSYTTIFNLLVKARLDSSVAGNGLASIDGAVISYNSINKEYDMTFGSSSSPDSISRSGRIVIRMSGDLLSKGSYGKVYFDHYFEDSGRVSGSDSISNDGVNTSGQMVFSETVSKDTIVKVLGNGAIKFDIHATYKILASDLLIGNNIQFLLGGTLSGISSKGCAFSASVKDTLIDSFSCPWMKEGIIDVSVPSAEITSGYIEFVSKEVCSDVIWYYFGDAAFKVRKNKFYLKN
jgi:hypothetical protein